VKKELLTPRVADKSEALVMVNLLDHPARHGTS
jgi:hypothetical protein